MSLVILVCLINTLGDMSGMHRLDEIDRMILAELQADGRMTNVESVSYTHLRAHET